MTNPKNTLLIPRVAIVAAMGLAMILAIGCNRIAASNKSVQTSKIQEPGDAVKDYQVDGKTGATHYSFSLGISGLVRQPMSLDERDLEQYQSIGTRLNDIHRDGSYHGVHEYRGVPLKTLLDQAHVEKEQSIFGRPIDLAIVVSNGQGDEVILSWGEVFYRNPADVLIAIDAMPVVPHKSCSSCHQKETYQDWLSQLTRTVGLPKLVVSGDYWSDRAIENVSRIEVRDIGRDVGVFLPKKEGPKKLFSESFQIKSVENKAVQLPDLGKLLRASVDLVQAGDGTGFHGIEHYEGFLLSQLLSKVGIEPDPKTMFVCSAPDGYRILLSSGEVFPGPNASGILLADRLNGKPIEDGGLYRLIPLGDLSADRWLKSVSRIDVLRLVEDPPDPEFDTP
ncbi:MAG: hypothetical protein GY847_36435 [Proteobacteria bacterium]|nr:hypothetical protein [Pseudomonadota bacterium]